MAGLFEIMRRILVIVIIVILSVMSAFPEAKLTLVSDEIDMGSFEATEIREGKVSFRNDGDAPLLILRVTSDCGCTVPSYPKDEIMPGDTASIKVRFNGKGREPGVFKKVIRITSQSGEERLRSLLFVKGKILRAIRK